MPIYEYRCRSCGKVFETLQRFSDPPLDFHEGCGGPVERLLSPPALQFKGTGWYVTDYARKGSPGGNGHPKSETKAESAAAPPKESKPAATTTDKSSSGK